MRDPLVRWLSAGLILALPVLIYVAAATSVVPAEKPRVLALAGVLGPVEAVLGLGLWLASRERRRLGSMQGAARPIGLGRGEAPKV